MDISIYSFFQRQPAAGHPLLLREHPKTYHQIQHTGVHQQLQ